VIRIQAKTTSLESHSKLGRIVPEFGIPEIREIFEGNYRIIYSVESKQSVNILTIHHGARDIKARNV
jgi:plasmid stabilization system protein ParE